MATDDLADEPGGGRSARTETLWTDVRMSPIEIALPGGVGYTLRAYRSSTEVSAPEADDEAETLDDFDAASAAVARRRRSQSAEDSDSDEADFDTADKAEDELEEELDESDFDEDSEDEEEDEEEVEEEPVDEEIPVFLGRRGRLYLFHSPEKLVEFVKSGAEHDLSQLDTWSDLAQRIRADDVVVLDEDSYELDLVVENLRGGADAWDATLILKAGEVARDLGYALRMEAVQGALAAGSPLDDLDEVLRAADGGGVGAFFAKRKLRKIPAQQSALAWRTVIGKISAAADWRD